jgi:hypothetical protein
MLAGDKSNSDPNGSSCANTNNINTSGDTANAANTRSASTSIAQTLSSVTTAFSTTTTTKRAETNNADVDDIFAMLGITTHTTTTSLPQTLSSVTTVTTTPATIISSETNNSDEEASNKKKRKAQDNSDNDDTNTPQNQPSKRIKLDDDDNKQSAANSSSNSKDTKSNDASAQKNANNDDNDDVDSAPRPISTDNTAKNSKSSTTNVDKTSDDKTEDSNQDSGNTDDESDNADNHESSDNDDAELTSNTKKTARKKLTAEKYYNKANECYAKKMYAEAAKYFELAQEELVDERYPGANFKLGAIYAFGLGGVKADFRKAIDNLSTYYKDYIEDKNSYDEDVLYGLAYAYCQKKQYTLVIKYGTKFLENWKVDAQNWDKSLLDLNHAGCLYLMGEAYRNKLKKAANYYFKSALCGYSRAYYAITKLKPQDNADEAAETDLYTAYLNKIEHIATTPGNEHLYNKLSASPSFKKNTYDHAKEAHDKFVATFDFQQCNNIIVAYKAAITQGIEEAQKRMDLLTNQIITRLIDKSYRHAWEDDKCVRLCKLLEKIDIKYKEFDKQKFEQCIEEQEKNAKTFFGVELSDDSDSDEEQNFQKCPTFVRNSTHFHSFGLFKRANQEQAIKKLNQLANAAEDNLPFSSNLEILKPDHEKITTQQNVSLTNALNEINYQYENGNLEEGIKRAKAAGITFVIAQFHGVTYRRSTWGAKERRAHRKQNEINKPFFSAAVYKSAKISFSEPRNTETEELLKAKAQEIRNNLVALRSTGVYKEKYTHKDSDNKKKSAVYSYPSFSHYLHSQYIKSYHGFLQQLKTIADGTFNISNMENHDDIREKIKSFACDNPLLSMSDTPLHALKYAYAIKPYMGYERERLHPRWNADGKAERPYDGKVYLSLDPLADYDQKYGTTHVISANHLGKLRIDSVKGEMILAEHETDFQGYLPEDRIKHVHIAKYPSFCGEYKDIYEAKYGIDRNLYYLFQKVLQKFPPNSKGNKLMETILGEYLCSYHQVRLLDKARQLAQDQSAHLVYINEYGKFSLCLASLPPTTGKSMEQRAFMRQNREEHTTTSSSSSSSTTNSTTLSSSRSH